MVGCSAAFDDKSVDSSTGRAGERAVVRKYKRVGFVLGIQLHTIVSFHCVNFALLYGEQVAALVKQTSDVVASLQGYLSPPRRTAAEPTHHLQPADAVGVQWLLDRKVTSFSVT